MIIGLSWKIFIGNLRLSCLASNFLGFDSDFQTLEVNLNQKYICHSKFHKRFSIDTLSLSRFVYDIF